MDCRQVLRALLAKAALGGRAPGVDLAGRRGARAARRTGRKHEAGTDVMSMTRRFLDRLGKYFRAPLYARQLPYLRPYKQSIAIVLVLLLAQIGLSLAAPWSLKILV